MPYQSILGFPSPLAGFDPAKLKYHPVVEETVQLKQAPILRPNVDVQFT